MSIPAVKDKEMGESISRDELYVYDLPQDILSTLELMKFDNDLVEVQNLISEQSPGIATKTNNPANSCTSCRLESFNDAKERRYHFKTDLHRFNIKRAIDGLSPVSLDEFSSLTENDEIDSVSGSEYSSDEDDFYKEQKDELTTIIENELSSLQIQTQDALPASHLNTKSPFIFMKSKKLPETKVFGVYKAIFDADSLDLPLSSLSKWRNADSSKSFSAMFMIGGGHFAGAIVCHERLSVKGNVRKAGISLQEQAVQFLEHKTFHRYTTRRKQGGSQSANDNAKGKANSAGSNLRRFNEAALKTDIQGILKNWEPLLEKCENIYLRAKSVSDRKIFTEGSSCISKGNKKIKTFPFTTMRPTSNELRRAWCQLTYLSVIDKPKVLPKKNVSTTQNPQLVERTETTSIPSDSAYLKEKSDDEMHTAKIISFIQKSKAPLLISYLKKNKLDINFRLKPDSRFSLTPTMLHYAALHASKHMIVVLLTTLKHDPAVLNSSGKTPWDLAKRTEIREAFQLARHTLGESFADWESSHVGNPLSNEQIDELHRKEKEEDERSSEEAIKRELEAVKERLKKEKKEKEEKKRTGRQLGSPASMTQINLNSLSEDQRLKIMREQRARAAEARMRKLELK